MKKMLVYQLLLGAALIVIVILGLRLWFYGGAAASQAPVIAETEKTGQWRTISPRELTDNPVGLFADDWMALTAGKSGDLNTMTIGWGTLGNLWGKPVVTVYVSPDRYTHSFMERNDYFTLTAVPTEHKNKLAYIGSHSGRDGDKIAAAGLTLEYTEAGNPTFTDGRLVIECRKIYAAPFDPGRFNAETAKIYSKGMGVHHFYIGEIVSVRVKE